MKGSLGEKHGGELLPGNFWWNVEKESRREAVPGVCEYERSVAGGADLLDGKDCVEFKSLFCKQEEAVH